MQFREINDCSQTTATRDLKELIDRNILKTSGKREAGSFYELIAFIYNYIVRIVTHNFIEP